MGETQTLPQRSDSPGGSGSQPQLRPVKYKVLSSIPYVCVDLSKYLLNWTPKQGRKQDDKPVTESGASAVDAQPQGRAAPLTLPGWESPAIFQEQKASDLACSYFQVQ